jgi:predicted nucleic acid-binding protein
LILADTSVWIDHLRSANPQLRQLLHRGEIAIHPFIVAELALGSLKNRAATLALLDLLPHVSIAQLGEVRNMVETRHLYNLGIGLTDAHLIASIFLSRSTLLWTNDKHLRKAAAALGIHVSFA